AIDRIEPLDAVEEQLGQGDRRYRLDSQQTLELMQWTEGEFIVRAYLSQRAASRGSGVSSRSISFRRPIAASNASKPVIRPKFGSSRPSRWRRSQDLSPSLSTTCSSNSGVRSGCIRLVIAAPK